MKKIKIIISGLLISVLAISFWLGWNKNIARGGTGTGDDPIIVCLDPGHGGDAPGAVSGDLKEKDINLDVAKRVREILENSPTTTYNVVMTREEDETLSSGDRYTFCNNAKADLMVSVHTNSVSDPSVDGTESYYFQDDDKILAEYEQRAMVNSLWASSTDPSKYDRGVKKAAYGVLLKSKMPSTEVEPVFMSDSDGSDGYNEAELLQTTIFACDGCRREQIAQAIYNGIQDYVDAGIPQPEKPGNGGHGKPDVPPGKNK